MPTKHDRFEAIYLAHAGCVLRYLRYRVGPDAAEDLVAETFALAWAKWAQVPDPPRPWLLASARRLSANHLRSRRRRLTHELTELDHVASTADDVDALDRRRDLVAALRRLPSLDREAVLLVTWHDLTHAEAAEVMGCSTTAFTVRLHRARRRLHQILDPDHATTTEAIR